MTRFGHAVLIGLCLVAPARADDVALFAAGSLSGALTEVARAYTATTGVAVKASFGPSGLMRERIERGERAHVLASADMGHPEKLVGSGRAEFVVRFTGNRLCAMAPSRLGLTTDTVLDKALDPALRLGTSTPKADPGGDYTWAMFDAADKVRAGAGAALKAKALQLVGGPNSEPVPNGKNVIGHLFETGKADLFIAYCTSGKAAQAGGAAITVAELPPALAQTADYGLVVLAGAPEPATRLALFIVSEPGQAILAKWGFARR
jgi:molybdate transport system substrate-binding protein